MPRSGSTGKMTSPLPVERRGWRSCGKPDRDDETSPQTGDVTPVILFVHVRSEIGLQDDWTKAVTDQTADGNLALLLVSRNWHVEISGAEGDYTELPITELPAGRQIDIEEVGIAAIQCKGRRARRQLRTPRKMVDVSAPDGIRGQVPPVTGITKGEQLLQTGE